VGQLTSLITGKLVAFDSAPLIYYIEEHAEYLAITDELFGLLDSGAARGMTSVLTLEEVLVKPLKEGREELADQYRQVLTNSTNITLHPIDESVCETAARMRATYGWLRTPDALQVASAINHQAQVIITNDDRWQRLTEIEVAILSRFV
jgi:predicted nucleic acid-binding protein